ncbi:hypothetical protein ruthe_00086 [Rubellimicrobium thermophilum DSM 16684]|uniref:Uncharacterized protein n=1 Tax=Rubellimicrobium thermophilum DSM 16684 TaxID=1123069 RepID=S9R2G5_9RHOB|nr:hypothetical protein ruthe_00086 [Rubellimicrobium thermophilum DSM 16684]
MAGFGDLGVVGHELVPGPGDGQAQLLIDGTVVEDAPAHGRAEGDAAHGAVRGGDDLLETVEDIRLPLDVRQVEQRLFRPQRLEERAGIVVEDVGHFAGRKAGLDDVVALRSAGALFDVEGDIGMRRAVGGGQGLHRADRFGVAVDQDGQRHIGRGHAPGQGQGGGQGRTHAQGLHRWSPPRLVQLVMSKSKLIRCWPEGSGIPPSGIAIAASPICHPRLAGLGISRPVQPSGRVTR